MIVADQPAAFSHTNAERACGMLCIWACAEGVVADPEARASSSTKLVAEGITPMWPSARTVSYTCSIPIPHTYH